MIGVIADDLTGCGDIGLHFADYNLKTIVLTNPKSQIPNSKIDVLVVNTESRFDSPNLAYNKVKEVCRKFKELKIKKIYKKIDSTLRGNIGRELDALFDELKIKKIPFCAAFPKAGRTTLNGTHYVNGKIITETEFSSDPKTPVKESHIPTLLKRQSKNYDKIIVYDTQTQNDLKNIAKKVNSVFCGSAGLAEELVRFWCPKPDTRYQIPDTSRNRKDLHLTSDICHLTSAVLVVSGSANPRTYAQIDELKKGMNFFPILIDFKKNSVVLKKDISLENGVVIYPQKTRGNPDRIIKILTMLTKAVINPARPSFAKQNLGGFDSMIICGGDTSSHILEQLKINFFEIVSSVLPVGRPLGLPGISFCRTLDKKHNFILKPGGFGDKDALIECVKFLKRE